MKKPFNQETTANPDNKTAFDILLIAEDAIREKNFDLLAQIAPRLANMLSEAPYLLEPLIIIAEALGKNETSIPQSAQTFLTAANNATPYSGLNWRATNGFVNSVESLPALSDRIEMFVVAAKEKTLPGSPQQQKAIEGFVRNVERKEEISARIRDFIVSSNYADLGSELEKQSVENFVKNVSLQNEISERIESFVTAAIESRQDSLLETTAISGFIANTEHKRELSARIDIFKKTANTAPLNSKLEKIAVDNFVETVCLRKDILEKAEIFMYAALTARSESHMEKQTLANFASQASEIENTVARAETFLTAAYKKPGSKLEQLSVIGFAQSFSKITDDHTRNEILNSVITKAHPDSELKKHATALKEQTLPTKEPPQDSLELPTTPPTTQAALRFTKTMGHHPR